MDLNSDLRQMCVTRSDYNKYIFLSLFQLMQDHITEQVIISRSITQESMIQVISLNSNTVTLRRNSSEKFILNKHSIVIQRDLVASNGVLYKVDRVLYSQKRKTSWKTLVWGLFKTHATNNREIGIAFSALNLKVTKLFVSLTLIPANQITRTLSKRRFL